MSGKRTSCGDIERLIEREQQAIEQEHLLSRLWAQDETLWPYGDFAKDHLRGNLQFLHIPEALSQFMVGGLKANREAEQEGMTDKVLISFGSVHHFCKAALDLQPEGNKAFRFLESCHPDALPRLEEGLDPQRMFVILVNKSNYQIEDHALFLHFHRKLRGEVPEKLGKHFAAVTNADSYLATLSGQYRFRYLLEMPAGILAPYCSVLFLGLFLAGATKLEPEVLRIACREMKRQYVDAHRAGENPAGELAAFLAGAAKSGRRILRLVAAPALASFAAALCPLVGGSLGRGEHGLFPLASTSSDCREGEEKNTSYVLFGKGDEEDAGLEKHKDRLRALGTPFLEIGVSNPLDLVRQAFEWQLAVVLCASRLGIYPFEPADVLKGQTLAGEMLSGYAPGKDTFQRKARLREGGLQLFAEIKARREISQLNIIESLGSFFQQRASASYVSLFVFLQQREEIVRLFEGLRCKIEQKLALPVMLTWGPRSIYTYSYLLREEAPAGLHLVVAGEPKKDLNIPGANYKFGQLYMALALGQFEALSGANGLALRLHVGAASGSELAELENVVSQALRHVGA